MTHQKPYTREEIEKWRKAETVAYSPEATDLRWLATIDERDREISLCHAYLDNVSGALVDASTIKVGNEKDYADGIRALTQERNEAKIEALGLRSQLHEARRHITVLSGGSHP